MLYERTDRQTAYYMPTLELKNIHTLACHEIRDTEVATV